MLAPLCRVSGARSSAILLRFQKKTLIPEFSPSSSISRSRISDSTRRIARISRLPLNLSCFESMLPLHSTIASARLNSLLSAESWGWSLIPQVGFEGGIHLVTINIATAFQCLYDGVPAPSIWDLMDHSVG